LAFWGQIWLNVPLKYIRCKYGIVKYKGMSYYPQHRFKAFQVIIPAVIRIIINYLEDYADYFRSLLRTSPLGINIISSYLLRLQ
jgi:hypothetical protein